jgi:hypothetical protein
MTAIGVDVAQGGADMTVVAARHGGSRPSGGGAGAIDVEGFPWPQRRGH